MFPQSDESYRIIRLSVLAVFVGLHRFHLLPKLLEVYEVLKKHLPCTV
jgi:hypothetical protein